jgi:hypothetical protein
MAGRAVMMDNLEQLTAVFKAARHLRDWEMMDAHDYRAAYPDEALETATETRIIEELFAAVSAVGPL